MLTIKLSDLGVPSTCRQKANESSQGHFLNSLNLASDVGSPEEGKASSAQGKTSTSVRLAVTGKAELKLKGHSCVTFGKRVKFRVSFYSSVKSRDRYFHWC